MRPTLFTDAMASSFLVALPCGQTLRLSGTDSPEGGVFAATDLDGRRLALPFVNLHPPWPSLPHQLDGGAASDTCAMSVYELLYRWRMTTAPCAVDADSVLWQETVSTGGSAQRSELLRWLRSVDDPCT